MKTFEPKPMDLRKFFDYKTFLSKSFNICYRDRKYPLTDVYYDQDTKTLMLCHDNDKREYLSGKQVMDKIISIIEVDYNLDRKVEVLVRERERVLYNRPLYRMEKMTIKSNSNNISISTNLYGQ